MCSIWVLFLTDKTQFSILGHRQSWNITYSLTTGAGTRWGPQCGHLCETQIIYVFASMKALQCSSTSVLSYESNIIRRSIVSQLLFPAVIGVHHYLLWMKTRQSFCVCHCRTCSGFFVPLSPWLGFIVWHSISLWVYERSDRGSLRVVLQTMYNTVHYVLCTITCHSKDASLCNTFVGLDISKNSLYSKGIIYWNVETAVTKYIVSIKHQSLQYILKAWTSRAQGLVHKDHCTKNWWMPQIHYYLPLKNCSTRIGLLHNNMQWRMPCMEPLGTSMLIAYMG